MENKKHLIVLLFFGFILNSKASDDEGIRLKILNDSIAISEKIFNVIIKYEIQNKLDSSVRVFDFVDRLFWWPEYGLDNHKIESIDITQSMVIFIEDSCGNILDIGMFDSYDIEESRKIPFKYLSYRIKELTRQIIEIKKNESIIGVTEHDVVQFALRKGAYKLFIVYNVNDNLYTIVPEFVKYQNIYKGRIISNKIPLIIY